MVSKVRGQKQGRKGDKDDEDDSCGDLYDEDLSDDDSNPRTSISQM